MSLVELSLRNCTVTSLTSGEPTTGLRSRRWTRLFSVVLPWRLSNATTATSQKNCQYLASTSVVVVVLSGGLRIPSEPKGIYMWSEYL